CRKFGAGTAPSTQFVHCSPGARGTDENSSAWGSGICQYCSALTMLPSASRKAVSGQEHTRHHGQSAFSHQQNGCMSNTGDLYGAPYPYLPPRKPPESSRPASSSASLIVTRPVQTSLLSGWFTKCTFQGSAPAAGQRSPRRARF